MKKTAYVIWLIFFTNLPVFAQFSDNFVDGNFNSNPVWEGDTGKFEVDVDGKLHLNAVAENSQAFLSTPSEAVADATWICYVELSENPSSTNYTKIYLMSDQVKLDSTLNGYFVKIGGSTDEVSLFRQNGSSETRIIDGADDRVNTKPVKIQVKVTRSKSGNWTLFTQPEGAPDFVEEGSITDNTLTSSSFFGVYCQYTSTRSQAFFFDEFMVSGSIQPDEQPPTVQSQEVLSANQIALTFSESLDSSAVMEATHYTMENNYPASVAFNGKDSLVLYFSSGFTNGQNLSLHVQGLPDLAGNTMQDTTLTLLFFQEVPAVFRDIVINELLPDPNPQLDSLPSDTNAEFIELYNPSPNPFNLQGWSINDKAFPAFILLPDAYLILCRAEFSDNFAVYGQTLALPSWPSLSNTGGVIYLRDQQGALIDSLAYGTDLVQGGFSIEQVNPGRPCGLQNNYALSLHTNGATPGAINTVFDDAADTSAPVLLQLEPVHTDTLALLFDEPVDISSAQISLQPYIPIQEKWVDENNDNRLIVTLSSSLSSNTYYQLTTSGFADCTGNISSNKQQDFYFDTLPPEVIDFQWLDTASIQVVFNEALQEFSATQTDHYQLNPNQLSPEKALWGKDSSSVQLNFSTAFSPLMAYSLIVSNMEDLSGNNSGSDTLVFKPENHIDTVVVVNENQLDIYFHRALSGISAENPQNYWVDRGVGYPEAAVMHQENARLVHLIFGSSFTENKIHTLSMSHLLDVQGNRLSTPLYRFYYDTKTPAIIAIHPLDALHLEVLLDEVVADDLSSLQIGFSPALEGHIQAILQADQKSLLLTLNDSLQNQTSYTLSLSGLSDLSGNSMDNTQKFLYDLLPPSLKEWQFVSPTQLKVSFAEPVKEETAQNFNNYQIDGIGHPDSIRVSQVAPGTVYLYFSSVLPEEADLRIQNLTDQQGNALAEPLVIRLVNHFPAVGAICPLSSHSLKIIFSKEIASENVNAQDFLLNESDPPSKIAYNKEEPAAITLSFDHSFKLYQENLLHLTTLQDVQGNQVENLSATFVYDPMVEQVSISGSSSLEIHFTIPLDPKTAATPQNFEVLTLGSPDAVVWLNAYTLKLLFDTDFEQQQLYTLQIAAFRHAENGFIPASNYDFGTGKPPHRYELLITEIMADPSPAVSLPEAEYLEIFNPTDKILSLAGITLSTNSSTALLPQTIIRPGDYLIICSEADYSYFAPFGNTLPMHHFPSLHANEDQISLKNQVDEIIFSVHYTDAWYKDAVKKKGGWSLEMVDFNRPCGEIDNWAASEGSLGGTPGEVNSIQQPNPDHFGPQVLQAMVIEDRLLQIQFNEKIDPNSLYPDKFSLSDPLKVVDVQLSENEKEVMLSTNANIPAGKELTIQVNQITDCSGNLIQPPYNSATFGKPEEAVMGDLLLSEILFAPRAGGVRFVEIYNNSEKYINLKKWSIASWEEDTIKEQRDMTDKNFIIVPKQYLVFTENKNVLKGDYPSTHLENTVEVGRLPSFSVSEGTVVLLSPADSMMQLFTYKEDLHHPLIKDRKGVSLERIAWEEPADNPELWQSAASSVGFATPGYRNSQMMQPHQVHGMLTVDPAIFSPDQNGFHDYTRINYLFHEPGNVATIRIFDTKGKKVRDLIQNKTLAQEGFVIWDGTNDDHRPVSIGYYLVLLEVYNPQGGINVFKQKVVVGTQLY